MTTNTHLRHRERRRTHHDQSTAQLNAIDVLTAKSSPLPPSSAAPIQPSCVVLTGAGDRAFCAAVIVAASQRIRAGRQLDPGNDNASP